MHKRAKISNSPKRSPIKTRSKRQLLCPTVNCPLLLERQIRRDKRIDLIRNPVSSSQVTPKETTIRLSGYQFVPFQEDYYIEGTTTNKRPLGSENILLREPKTKVLLFQNKIKTPESL